MTDQQRPPRRPRLRGRSVALIAAVLALAGGTTTLAAQATAYNVHPAAQAPAQAAAHAAAPAAAPKAAPTAPATRSATPSAAPTPAPTPAVTPVAAAAPSSTPTPSPSATPSATPTATPSPTPAAQPSVKAVSLGTTGTAPADADSAKVGALFSGSVAVGNHFCTASVVDSPGRDLLLTAGHCLSSPGSAVFAPGYRNGSAPYGTWKVTQVFATTGWSQNGDTDQDFAFLTVAPLNGKQIEDVVGANQLGLDASFTAQVRLYGYPASSDLPLLCTNATTKFSSYQREIACPAYSGGTSGGPFVSTDTGQVIGIIGGYQQGGDTDDISYSAYFDQTIANLYATAISHTG
ncbi:hypothetical protein GCM10009760_21080 [Kitasatospora kazusensis]|uniref:Serine protease n=1 Tax=Kitasatospora kazusensis TaxID=407974 RepID=A0ABN2ZAE0_9ACTN